MSSRAYLVDLISSIGEKLALIDHLEEKALDDKTVVPLIQQITTLRREQMTQLLSYAKKPNPRLWCDFKHACKVFTLDKEVFEATFSDDDYDKMKKSANILASITSLFLGMEFESCSRCLYDKLLVEQKEKKT